ncbi:MAG: succinylglutamate desuccinylase, partial [Burkholderiales bacterium PBB5]
MSTNTPLHPLQSVHFAGMAPGPRLIVTGAVHGNEVCGTIGIRRVIAEIESGALVIARGSVAFVPVCNPQAY